MAGHASSNDSDTDWRRLASDRNVSHDVARALWEQARAAAPEDPAQAEHAFHLMLDEAEAANITHEPGRETLAGGRPSPRDAASLGPGKWTRVLLEQPRPAAPVAATDAEGAAKKPTAETIKSELAAAGQAGKQAVAAIAAADPATIVEALRELGSKQTGLLGKLMSMATGAVERVLDERVNWDVKVTPPPAPKAKPGTPAKPGAPGARVAPDEPPEPPVPPPAPPEPPADPDAPSDPDDPKDPAAPAAPKP